MSTKAIVRHDYRGADDEFYVRELGEEIEDLIPLIPQAPYMLESLLGLTLNYAKSLSMEDPQAERKATWVSYRTAMQTGAALFGTLGRPAGEPWEIANISIEVPPTDGVSGRDPGNWLTAMWLTLICRDREHSSRLAHINTSYLRNPNTEFDPYIFHWIEALQSYWTGRDNLIEQLTAAIELSNPDSATIAGREAMNFILYHPINLFHKFLLQDHDGFNKCLEDSLQMHKQYWTANPERVGNIESLVALGPLAMAALAHDAGFPITVESGYIPKGLVTGQLYGHA